MKVCDVVKNSIWFDPRVRKQILSYKDTLDCEVVAIGMRDLRYDEAKVEKIPCEVKLAAVDEKYFSKKRTFFKKVKRELTVNRELAKLIVESNPDVIHANDLNALVPAYKAAKKLKSKLIYDSHEVFLENIGISNSKLTKTVWAFWEKKLTKKINKMVCVSSAAAEYFEKKYNIEKPLVVTNCCIKAEQCISDEKNDGFEILNHGQFYEGRGYDIMVESIPLLKEYPEIKLAVRGFGKLEETLKNRAKELGDENFRFYPKVLVEELIPMASKSKVGVAITEGVCLNFQLSVSNKLFEYAAAGLPVIMSDIPEHRYLNDKYQFGVIIPENTPEAFAEAVVKLYTDKNLYQRCVENAKKLSDEVNWENEFAKLIEFEKRLIEEANNG